MLGWFVPTSTVSTEETDVDCQATLSISVTQCDPTSATTPLHWPAPATVHVSCPAKRLAHYGGRGDLAIRVLTRTETVSELAREHEVSRKFLYQQVHTAQQALDSAFAPVLRSEEVLFYLPVTKSWLRQLVLALVFICHSSTRGVVELLRDVFDFRESLGTVHNIVHSPVAQARRINQQYNLSTIVIGLLDEIFHARSRFGGGRCPSHLLLLAESGRASRRRYLGRPAAGTGRPRLRSPGHYRRFRLGAPRRASERCCLRSPAAVMFFMRCTTLGRWSVYLENPAFEAMNVCAKLRPKQLPPHVVVAARTRVWPRSYRTHGRLRPRRSCWLMRWRY